MNSSIDTLNQWGGGFLDFAWPMLWQSSLLITLIFTLDLLLARKIRAAVRYGLWLVVLVKLVLPPTLAVPTSAGWWLFRQPAVATPVEKFTVVYGNTSPTIDQVPHSFTPAAKPELDVAGYALLGSTTISVVLFVWLLVRWQQLNHKIRHAAVGIQLETALESALNVSGLRSRVAMKMVEGYFSPAVCGLFKPVILLPRVLVEKLSAAQLRAVLLHELFHHRRKDVWVNCAQTFLQIFYWWHPLLWIANARVRRVREEAVDDAVMLALSGERDLYAPTLLEVAKLAFYRSRLNVGLVGIMESRSALRKRIERLVNFRAPRTTGLPLVSILAIVAFIAVAVPMGGAPAPEQNLASPVSGAADDSIRVFKIERPVDTNSLNKIIGSTGATVFFFDENNWILVTRGSSQQLDSLERSVQKYWSGPIKTPPFFGLSGSDKKFETNLFNGVYTVDRHEFPSALRDTSGVRFQTEPITASNLFSQLGVNGGFPQGKFVAYSSQKGLLFVKATKQDLNLVQQVVGVVGPNNYCTADVHIKAQFIEAPIGSINFSTNDPDNFRWIMDGEYAKKF